MLITGNYRETIKQARMKKPSCAQALKEFWGVEPYIENLLGELALVDKEETIE